MLLIVDANIVFAALITKGKTFDLFVWNELNNRLEFVAPEYLSTEIRNNLEEVLRKSKLSKAEFEEVLTMVELQIDFIPADEFIKTAGIGVTDYIFIKVLGFLSPITHHL